MKKQLITSAVVAISSTVATVPLCAEHLLPVISNVSRNSSNVAQGKGIVDINDKSSAESLSITESVGQVFVFRCPSFYPNYPVWGTGIYSGGSSICNASLHIGAISQNGGVVKVKILGSQSRFRQSQRNGVLSQSYGEYPTSFGFLR
jgi:hypothetical protein